MMQTTEGPRRNVFQHAWRSIRGLFLNKTTENAVLFPPSTSSLEIAQTKTITTVDDTEPSGTSSPQNIQIAVTSSAHKAVALLEPFNSLLIKQFSIDDVYTLKKGLERKLEFGISIDYIQRQLQNVMNTYDNTANIDDVLDGLADICGVEVLKLRKKVTRNNGEKSLQTSIKLFNKKFSKPCELTQKQCLSLPPNILPIILNNFEATRRLMQNNGLIFNQLKLLAESSSGQFKLEILLKDDSGLIRLIEHDIAFEKLAELNLNDFKMLLTGTELNKYVELLRELQPNKMF